MSTSSRLWIDVTDMLLWSERKTGVQRVIHNLIEAYAGRRDVDLFYFSQRRRAFFTVKATDYLTAERKIEPLARVGAVTRWRTYLAPLVYSGHTRADFRSGDVLLIPGGHWRRRHFLECLRRVKDERSVVIQHFVHDVMPITTPHLFPPDETDACLKYLAPAFTVADAILTTSRWNAGQISSLIEVGVLPDRPVAPVGLGAMTLPAEPREPPAGASLGDFALSVGTFEIKKNRRVLYEAYRSAREAGVGLPKLVIAGQPGGLPDNGVYLLENDPAIEDQVVVLRDASDGELAWLYLHALYTVFGSLAEGWGLPITESLDVGTPCLSSSFAGMPEAGQDAAVYFDPLSGADLLTLMTELQSPGAIDALRGRVRDRYVPRTWSDVCDEIDKVRG